VPWGGDVVVVGGGIAGGAVATALAEAGCSVVVLERAGEYRDRVRGEYLQPWGVAEVQRLGLLDRLLEAGGNVITRLVPYDELYAPDEAEAVAVPLDTALEGVPGAVGIAHPIACEALATAAAKAGATVVRNVEAVAVTPGVPPSVQWVTGGVSHETTCGFVVGADGRESSVRRQLELPLHAGPVRLLGAGLLVEGLRRWRADTFAVGTEGDRLYFVVPIGGGRGRLYLMYDAGDRRRFAGADKAARFLEDFDFRCIPGSDEIVAARPAGPCAVYPMHDSWVDDPVVDGVALVGDAAGYSDPHLGQGLSVAMRDARLVFDVLAHGDWSRRAFAPYVSARREGMRRLRWVNDLVTTLRGEFGADARERRRRAMARMRDEPDLAQFRRATSAGPDAVPADAFDASVAARLLAP
jgi:2-polyprenyl-6-methoxyphenol hydroxylase-like FAD-dependent oxidoreductase